MHDTIRDFSTTFSIPGEGFFSLRLSVTAARAYSRQSEEVQHWNSVSCLVQWAHITFPYHLSLPSLALWNTGVVQMQHIHLHSEACEQLEMDLSPDLKT